MGENGTILVHTEDAAAVRGRGPRELEIETLSENVSRFLAQIESIIGRAPEDVGSFRLNEFEVSAEVSAEGKLALIGTGVGAAAKVVSRLGSNEEPSQVCNTLIRRSSSEGPGETCRADLRNRYEPSRVPRLIP